MLPLDREPQNQDLEAPSPFQILSWERMVMTWEYHAKQSNSDGNSHKPYDFLRMWDIQQKAQIIQRKAHRHRQQFRGYQREKVGGGRKG